MTHKEFKKRIAATGLRHKFIAEQVEISTVHMSNLHTGDKPLTEAMMKKFEKFFKEKKV